MILSRVLYGLKQVLDDFRTALRSQNAAVQAKGVVFRLTPDGACVQFIIGFPFVVFVPDSFFGGVFPVPVDGDDPLGPLFIGSMNEHRQAIGNVPEDVVGAAANDDAGALGRQIGDHFLLGQPQLIRIRLAVVGPSGQGVAVQAVR